MLEVLTRICIVCSIGSMAGVSASAAAEPGQSELTFEKDIMPIFRLKCLRCHAGVEPKAGLNLTQPSMLLTGGKSGPALRIAAAEFSLLYEKIAANEMPAAGPKLTAEEKGTIRTWINEGAKGVSNAAAADGSNDVSDEELWSFKPPVRPRVPVVADDNRVTNPIDAFVLKRLETKQLHLAGVADRLTLLRRAHFDLVGLPPSPEDIERFRQDDRPDAYVRMIDRLLAEPHYGERWGRHWLDVAGYAETAGVLFEDRPLDVIWRYRDYVIRALNKDKPYDRFLQEQIAGDELTDYWTAYETMDRLPEEVVDAITATGFLRTAPDPSRPDFNTIKNAAAQYYYPTLFDTLQIVCSSTMGLTVQCARCHSHKYDPIPQTEYYRLQAVFTSAYRPNEWVPQMKRRLLVATRKQKEATEKKNAEVAVIVKELNGQLAVLKKEFGQRLFDDRSAKLSKEFRDDVKAAFAVAADQRTQQQNQFVSKFEKQLRPIDEELVAALNEDYADYKAKAAELSTKIAAEQSRHSWYDEVRALYDLPGDVRTPILIRGDPLTPGPHVEPGVLSALETPQPFDWSSPQTDAHTSGRRLAFARWLTQPEHPLTARVMVNRIWMHHFGRGIVDTPDDFGVSGSPPSHPELLDWLATELVRSSWSLKHIHRLILTSDTWRQRSRVTIDHRVAGEKSDPDNELLWRQRMRRLEAEPLRDAFLAASGSLNAEMFGRAQQTYRSANGEVYVPDKADPRRRSVYVAVRRLYPDTMLEAFDQPRIEVNCTSRATSTVSTQALTILNSRFMNRAADAFADRVKKYGGDDPASYAVLTAFSRAASDDERKRLTEFISEQAGRYLNGGVDKDQARRKALADLCHMLLSANEFIYID